MGSRDVIGHVTIRLPGSTFFGWSIVTMRPSGTGPGHRKKDGRMEKERGRGGEGKGKGKWRKKEKERGKRKNGK